MRQVFLSLTLTLPLLGCGSKVPVVAHGKPVAHWISALRDRDPRVRQKAVRALGHVGVADPAALPALVGALQDPDDTVRARVALALLNLGPAARQAEPALEQACRDRSRRVRDSAALALKRLRASR